MARFVETAARMGAAQHTFPYQRRAPEVSLLHQTVRAHWKSLLADVALRTDGGSLPGFVTAEFDRYLKCGVLAHGFARVRCASCREEMLVALSCKGRGFCPSCTTRRMQGTATHLVDRVIPRVPVRQWVLSLPRWARFLLARDPLLITRALDRALREIFKLHRQRARRLGLRGTQAGAVTFVQRFGSALNLNVHFHAVIPDGVFTRDPEELRFQPLPGPTDEELQLLVRKIAVRVRKLLQPKRELGQQDARQPDALAMSQASSIAAAQGSTRRPWVAKPHAAYFEGFSLHAGVHLHANDREGLAHLCGYGARPALSQERLSALPDGRLSLRLKRPFDDGRTAIELEPLELLRRLATLVPPPRAHLVRFHGVFAPASTWRKEVVRYQVEPPATTPSEAVERAAATPTEPTDEPERTPSAKLRRDSQIPWAELLQRVFRIDVLACPCGGRRTVLAFITDAKVARSILEAMDLPTTAPPLAKATLPHDDQHQFWQDDVPELQQQP